MYQLIKLKYVRLLDSLDRASAFIRGHTCELKEIFNTSRIQTEKGLSPQRWLARLEPLGVLLVLTALAMFSRVSQYNVMANVPEDYFLQGLRNVSTTNDAGFYMQMASEWLSKLRAGGGFFDISRGELPGYLVAKISMALNVSLEEAARYLVYSSVTATAFVTYCFLAIMGLPLLGLVTGSGLIFFFPVYGRTSLGMVDTDLLNLFFLILISTLLLLSVKSRSLTLAIVITVSASITYHTFQLWYPRPGFLLVLCGVFIGILMAFRANILRGPLLLILFVTISGLGSFNSIVASVHDFVKLYVLQPDVGSAFVEASGIDLKALIFPTVSEISNISVNLIVNDYGSVLAFSLSLFGIGLFLAQDWRRIFVVSIFLAFLTLYFSSGQRFSFYAAPITLIGFFVATSNLAYLFWRPIVRLYEKEKLELIRTKLQREAVDSSHQSGQTKLRTITIRAATGLALLGSCWLAGVFPPPGVTPPPVVRAEELTSLMKVIRNIKIDDAFLASWWDYGYEIRYHTGLHVVSDGADPASVKNVYLARALISSNPDYAADEIRFAAYFSAQDLLEAFPRRPELSLSRDVNKDIYIFLPSDLQDKMVTVFNIAAATVPKETLRAYDSERSTFVMLYHKQPLKWGQFELVAAEKEGAVIYRLKSPKS